MASNSNIEVLTIGEPQDDVEHEHRAAVRCILTKGPNICIIHVKEGNFYKLPGGGIEPDDPNDSVACKREALEETGCEVDVQPEMIAKTIEYRVKLKQESRAYICPVIKDTGKVELTELEASEGLTHMWCEVDEALQKTRNAKPTTFLGQYIRKRDEHILECYKVLQIGKVCFVFRDVRSLELTPFLARARPVRRPSTARLFRTEAKTSIEKLWRSRWS